MIYVKIIGNNFGAYPYRVGLNTLAHNGETFNADPECGPGGLYYCELGKMTHWLGYGDQLCIVEPVGQIVQVSDKKAKTDKLVITKIMMLYDLATWEFLEPMIRREFLNGDWDKALSYLMMEYSKKYDIVAIVKLLVAKGVHIDSVSYIANIKLVDYLVAAGAYAHAAKYIVEWAAGRLYIVNVNVDISDGPAALRVFFKNGYYNCPEADYDRPAEAATGHRKVVDYVKLLVNRVWSTN